MKITALRLFNVKRFAGRGVAIEGIGDGVNVLSAANEFGKSTSFEALHALFFQAHSGAPKDVKRLQPYSGGNPLIEADIVTGRGRFRLTKQFIGQKRATIFDLDTGRLLAQADEAENFIAALTRGGTSGPAGLLWVRQGITGVEDRPRREAEDERDVRKSLLSSVQGEVEAVTGGRRMDAILRHCEEELERLVTPTWRPRAGGPYQQALDERARLLDEKQRLTDDVAALRAALDRRGTVLRRLAELEDADEVALRQQGVTAARENYELAQARAESLKTAEAERALAASELKGARQRFEEFRGASEQAAKLSATLAEAEIRRAELKARRDAAGAAIAAAMTRIDTAAVAERESEAYVSRLEAAGRARQAATELAALQQKLGEADELRAEIEKQQAELTLLVMPEGAIDRLQSLETKLAEARVALTLSQPSFLVEYAPGAKHTMVHDGVPLRDGEERSFGAIAQLHIEGTGTVTLRGNQPEGKQTALNQAEQARDRLLASLGVASLSDARRRDSEVTTKAHGLELLRQRLRHLVPDGMARLREEIARQEAVPAEFLEIEGDPALARRAHAAARQEYDAARHALLECQPARQHADEAFLAAERDWSTRSGELSRLDAILGPELDRPARLEELATTLARLELQAEKLDSRLADLRHGAGDIVSISAALERARSIEAAADQEASRRRETLAELNGQIRTRADDAVEEALNEVSDALAAAEGRVAAYESEVAMLRKLRETLQGARSAARDQYLKPVIGELRPLLSLLFDDASIVFDEETLLPQSIRRNGLEEEVDRLSGGMREQLSILTRLAFARLLARTDGAAPVILDDALVYSDDERIERMFDALHRQARDQQIIVFSCRQRAFSRLGGNVLDMTDWIPEHA